jgi:hypothetical protein
MRYTTLIAPMMALTVAACGSSSNTTQGTTLAYTDPSDTTSWRLVADASRPKHISHDFLAAAI